MHACQVVLAKNPTRLARIDIYASIACHELDIEQPCNLCGGFGHAVEVAHGSIVGPPVGGVKTLASIVPDLMSADDR
jgi:hypothetical protein